VDEMIGTAARVVYALAALALLVIRVRIYWAARQRRAPRGPRYTRDLVTGLIIVGAVAAAAVTPAAVAHDLTGHIAWWLILPLLIPAGLLAMLLRSWSRGGYWDGQR
jgi:amino acid transporter